MSRRHSEVSTDLLQVDVSLRSSERSLLRGPRRGAISHEYDTARVMTGSLLACSCHNSKPRGQKSRPILCRWPLYLERVDSVACLEPRVAGVDYF